MKTPKKLKHEKGIRKDDAISPKLFAASSQEEKKDLPGKMRDESS